MVLVGSRNGRNGSVSINQDVDMYAVKATDDGEKLLKTYLHRHIWIQAVKGDVKVENETLNSGDGAGITGVESLRITWTKGSEFLVVDLP